MTDQSVLAAWGVTVTAGYLATHAMGVAGTTVLGLSPFGSIVAVWALLMLVPVAMTAVRAARRGLDAHHGVWVGLVVLAMAQNVYAVASGGGRHAAHGHGGSGSASESAEGGHHGEASGSGHAEGEGEASASAPSTATETASAPADSGGHPHPDGGHGEGAASGTDAPSDTAASAGHHADAAVSEGQMGGEGHHGDTGATGATSGGLVNAADLQHASFYHVWFLVGALGFAYSAASAQTGARKALYGTAALLNALMVVALVAVPGTEGVAFLVAAAVQGLPMLADLPLRAREHAAA